MLNRESIPSLYILYISKLYNALFFCHYCSEHILLKHSLYCIFKVEYDYYFMFVEITRKKKNEHTVPKIRSLELLPLQCRYGGT